MTPARCQRLWPLLAAAVVIGVTAFAIARCELGPFPIALPAATMTFGIVASGFVATQRNMLLGMRGAEVLRFAAKTGFYEDVLAYLMDCIQAGLVVTALSLAGIFLSTYSHLSVVWLPLLAGGITLVVCLVFRNERLMGRIVHRFLEEQ